MLTWHKTALKFKKSFLLSAHQQTSGSKNYGIYTQWKSLVNLESEVSEKDPIMKLQVQLHIEQQCCVWNTSPELGFMLALCNVFLICYFIILLQFFIFIDCHILYMNSFSH